MTEEYKHINLLKALLNHKGTAMISSYDNDIYNDTLKGWAKLIKKGKQIQLRKESKLYG